MRRVIDPKWLGERCKPGQVIVPIMGNTEQTDNLPDSAAIFAAALSLWRVCKQCEANEKSMNLSASYNGMDEFMREVMRVANLFETWACRHIAFDQLQDVWPYFLEDRFGEMCVSAILPTALAEFDETDCLRVAIRLRLPVTADGKLPVPVDETALNPVAGSVFRAFRIQTVRDSVEENECEPFTSDDEPFDEQFGFPYFGLYGVNEDGTLEHIADRCTYAEAVKLFKRLAPGIQFPDHLCPTFLPKLNAAG